MIAKTIIKPKASGEVGWRGVSRISPVGLRFLVGVPLSLLSSRMKVVDFENFDYQNVERMKL